MHTQSAANAEVVVVTGASSGVGRAVARAFGARGARVVPVARNSKPSTLVQKRSGAPEGMRSSVRLTSLTQARSSEPP